MKKATPRQRIDALYRSAVGAADTLAAANFKTLWFKEARSPGKNGQYQGHVPQFEHGNPIDYDEITMEFDHTSTGTVSAAVLTVYCLMPDGSFHALGTSTLASGKFPPVTFDSTRLPLFVAVTTITGSTPVIATLKVYMIGKYKQVAVAS